jgi:hypothetical protein
MARSRATSVNEAALGAGTATPVADLAALHDALACATTAAVQAWRGDREPASLSLLEAHVAAEEAFGPGSPEVEALNVVFAAITQAAHSKNRRPAGVSEHHGRPRTYPA